MILMIEKLALEADIMMKWISRLFLVDFQVCFDCISIETNNFKNKQ